MQIAICEDDRKAAERLSAAINDWADTRKVEVDILCYDSAEAFIMSWPDISFDLVFLDIQMRHMTGIELAETIRKTDKNIMLVFVTSFQQYVLDSYDVEALHYLIKPLSAAKLLPILDKAYVIWRDLRSDFLMIDSHNMQCKLPFNDIYYISMRAHTAEICTIAIKYTMRKTAKELMEFLPAHFIRCHRTHIVNLFKVDCIYKESLRLSSGIELPVSRNSLKRTKDAFMRLHMG